MRISKRTREQAAIIASALAFEHAEVSAGRGGMFNIDSVSDAIGADFEAVRIFRAARDHVFPHMPRPVDFVLWSAETDALLRSGWSPP